MTVIPPSPAPPAPALGAAERRKRQRRLSLGRRVVDDRRKAPAPPDPIFADQREGIRHRANAARRKRSDRRAGVRLYDLRKLDLSEMDS